MSGKTLTAREACAYAGCGSMATFHAWVRKGTLPGPLPGTHSYSKDAIDEFIRLRAGLKGNVAEVDSYQAWKQRAGAA